MNQLALEGFPAAEPAAVHGGLSTHAASWPCYASASSVAGSGLESPNLLIVGFLKCGTTSLAKHLSDHPEIASPIVKELYYLIDPTSRLMAMHDVIGRASFGDREAPGNDARFIDYFQNVDGKKYALDATPFYYSQQRALRYAEENPATKIIFMTRRPDLRLLSSVRFFHRMLQEYPDGSFAEFVDVLLDQGQKRAAYRRRIRKEFFVELFDDELEMGCYERHITRWVNAVGNDRVLTGTMEELRDDPHGFVSIVCDYLGIDAAFYDRYNFSPYLQSYEVRFPSLQKLARRMGGEDPMRYETISRFQSPFYRLSIPVLRNSLDRIYRSVQHKSAASSAEKEPLGRLMAYYAQANATLRDRYGIDYTGSFAN